jgi:hypothetical protein
MTEQTTEDVGILVDGSSRAVYAVPRPVLEAHQATPEQRAAFAAAAESSMPIPANHTLHVLSAEEMEPYRLSDAQRETFMASLHDAASREDVAGFEFVGRFPSDTYVWVEPWGAMQMKPRDAAATYRILGYYPPLR